MFGLTLSNILVLALFFGLLVFAIARLVSSRKDDE